MVKLRTIVNYTNNLLNIDKYDIIEEGNGLYKGLDLKDKDIKNIFLSVDFDLWPVVEKAIEGKADLLIAHHKPGNYAKEKIEELVKNNIFLCIYHFPLDAHSEVGNNIQILKKINNETKLVNIEKFGYHAQPTIGYKATLQFPTELVYLYGVLEKTINTKNIRTYQGNKKVENIGVISGGGTIDDIKQCKIEGVDTFITGYIDLSFNQIADLARPNNVNIITLGHSESERPGLEALAQNLRKKFPELEKVKVIETI